MSKENASTFERLGGIYLGREIDEPAGDPTDKTVLYDAKDLTTHGMIVGMTGSGKTGLAVGILEEAAIDGIPSISIDVKGDLTNLLLTFPELLPEDFRPWIDEGAAARKGKTADQFAADTASLWKNGLAAWGQGPDRIKRLKEAVDFRVFTPGSSRGVPMSLLGSLGRPPGGDVDAESQREQIMGTVSGLLTLLGLDADPIQSKEHILVSNILAWAWESQRELSLPDLIRTVQKPPFDSVGVLDLESFFPGKERTALALSLNNLLASPSFQSWREGAPLSVERLLHSPDGRPRHSVIYLAHLSDAERMFFVTRLLNDVIGWMRQQSGTGSLRALLYMDEVFGYLPPTANPPSKTPLLTLLKQARAYGVGVLLATQNPVDLDYKALSNMGTWMLGRLQTERDKLRVLDGLEGAQSGGAFDRAAADSILSSLGKRRFMLHNVHESGPVLFHTRWVLSYLAGPLTLDAACTLARETAVGDRGVADAGADAAPPRNQETVSRAAGTRPEASSRGAVSNAGDPSQGSYERPILPNGIEEVFVEGGPAENAAYLPKLALEARLHYVRASWGVDVWQSIAMLGDPADSDPWDTAIEVEELRFDPAPGPGATFSSVPSGALQSRSYTSWKRSAKAFLYREKGVTLLRAKALKQTSRVGESEGEFRTRLRHAARELRDTHLEKLRAKYDVRIGRLEKRIHTAEERIAREEAQYEEQKMASFLDVGTTLLGSFLGRKRVSRSTVSGVSRAAKRFGRAGKEKQDIAFAKEKLATLLEDFRAIEEELESALLDVRDQFDPDLIELETLELAPRKSDIEIERLALAWTPVP